MIALRAAIERFAWAAPESSFHGAAAEAQPD
jgi:hypothetical protein